MKRLALHSSLFLACALPLRADFTNGGFENGLNGWTVTYHSHFDFGSGPSNCDRIDNTQQPDQPLATTVAGFTLADIDLEAFCLGRMAKLNDIIPGNLGGKHVTTIRQTTQIQSGEQYCSSVRVQWAAALVDPGHGECDQPFFEIEVKVEGNVVASFSANASNASAPGSDWTDGGVVAGEHVWYRIGLFDLPLTGVSVGDSVEIVMTVADCSQGAHDGMAFIDCAEVFAPCLVPCNYQRIREPLCVSFVPNAFTPNGDGINDVHRLRGIFNACEVEYWIYNRWGNVVFHKFVANQNGFYNYDFTGWDGKVAGVPAEVDVYILRWEARNCTGVISDQRTLTLIL